MRFLIMLAALALASCDSVSSTKHYTCAPEDIDLIERRIEQCEESGWERHSCYISAVKAQCSKDFKSVCLPSTDSCEVSRLLND